MPLKNSEEYRTYMRDQMRRRRAEKGASAGTIQESIKKTPEDNLCKTGQVVLPPPSASPGEINQPKSAAALFPSVLGTGEIDEHEPENWHLFCLNLWFTYPDGKWFAPPFEINKIPGEQGFSCYQASGRCCLALGHLPPRSEPTGCVFKPATCIFYNDLRGRNEN